MPGLMMIVLLPRACCAGPVLCCPAANPTKEMRLQWQQEAKEK